MAEQNASAVVDKVGLMNTQIRHSTAISEYPLRIRGSSQ
jgi:hypothetical protein